MNTITLEDFGFPGDFLFAERIAQGVCIQCEPSGDVTSSIELTHSQARELAAWIMENTDA